MIKFTFKFDSMSEAIYKKVSFEAAKKSLLADFGEEAKEFSCKHVMIGEK